MTTDMLDVTPDCQIVSSRVIEAPIGVVYEAWTEPRHLERWWGPAGFTNTFKEFDLRPGGRWSFIMHGPDKGDYSNECVFLKIEKPVLIAWRRISHPLFQVVVSFEEIAVDKTRIVYKMLFETAGECNKIRALATEKNEENFDRLKAEVQHMMK